MVIFFWFKVNVIVCFCELLRLRLKNIEEFFLFLVKGFICNGGLGGRFLNSILIKWVVGFFLYLVKVLSALKVKR